MKLQMARVTKQTDMLYVHYGPTKTEIRNRDLC